LYAGQIVMALDYLHKKNVIYRDLKPENILMGADGYLKITDFGLSKEVVNACEKSYTFCGTPEYLAPEIYQNRGHDFTCDWWSLGALIYEMLSGAPPYYSKDKQKMLEDRLSKPIIMRDYFSAEAVDLLNGLLSLNPKIRLGRKGGD
jgi:serine/threonine protein kinase